MHRRGTDSGSILYIYAISRLQLNEWVYVCTLRTQAVVAEQDIPIEKRMVANAGKLDAKKHLEMGVQELMSNNIVQTLGSMLDCVVF